AYENGQLYVDDEGFVYLLSGTSYSAPQVSGAAALLAQAFPNLTGRQIADILLRSAFDVGAAGTDAVYGRGILAIARAFQPVGTTALAGGASALPLGDDTGVGSPAMGDALRGAALPAIVLDEYDRAFEANLGTTLRGAEPDSRLGRAIGMPQRSVSFGSGRTDLAFAIAEDGTLGQLRLGEKEADKARVLAARLTTQLGSGLRFGMAYSGSAQDLAARLQERRAPAFLVAPDAAGERGVHSSSVAAFALRKQMGGWGLTVSAEQGETTTGGLVR